MHCSEARRLIETAKAGLDDASVRALKEHLESCSECAAFARAERMLDIDFAAMTTDDNTGGLDPAALRREIEKTAAKRTIPEKIMSQIKYNITERPRLAAGLTMAVLAFLFITLVPLSYTVTTGYRMTLSYAGSAGEIPPALLNAAFTAIGYDNVSTTVSSDSENTEYVIDNIPTKNEADDIGAAVKELIKEKVSVDVKVEPVFAEKAGALYAQVMTKIKSDAKEAAKLKLDKGEILINDEALSGDIYSKAVADYQLQRDIEKLLAKKGMKEEEFNVKVKTLEGGDTRLIELNLGPTEVSQILENGVIIFLSDSTVAVKRPDPDNKGSYFEKSLDIIRENEADSNVVVPKLQLLIKLRDEGE
ncbi:MAG: hypothetical protein AB1746_01770 [Candidatus Zixiibacteriota bacterium]